MNDGALTGEQVVEAVTRGLRAGEAQYPTVKVWSTNWHVRFYNDRKTIFILIWNFCLEIDTF